MVTHHPVTSRRLRPALLVSLLMAACLTPTDGSGRFGEARVQPEFSEGDAPEDRGFVIDSIRTIIRRSDAEPPLVDTVLTYHGPTHQAWLIELQSVADEMDVTLELRVGSTVAYRGSRSVMVMEGSAGRAPEEPVLVAYTGAEIGVRVDVMPERATFNVIGDTRLFDATVYDTNDQVLTGRVVAWRSVDPHVASVNESGVVTAEAAGVTTITATVDGVVDSATVTVDTTLATSSTITADSSALNADGASRTIVTVRVLDADGNSVTASAGTVTLQSSLGTIGAVTDHTDGTYTATLTAGNTAGSAVITGALNGDVIGDTAIVELRSLRGDPTRTTIAADSAAMSANGTSQSVVTVNVLDADGNSINASGGAVALSTTHGQLSDVTDHSNGTYTATLIAGIVMATAQVTGTLNGQPIADTAFVEMRPLPPDPTTTKLTADSSSIAADGGSTTQVTVRINDSNGNPVGSGADTVALSTTLGVLSAVANHNNGIYTATLTAGIMSGAAFVTGTLNGEIIGDTAIVQLRALAPTAGSSTISADSSAIDADGESLTLITVRVLDANGNPVGSSAGTVTLTNTLGVLSDVTDHGNGTYSAILAAGTVSGTAMITGTLNGELIGDTAFVEFRPLPRNARTSTITADSTHIDADGASSTVITIHVRDIHGNLVSASTDTVTLNTTLGALSAVANHHNGTYTATLTAGVTSGGAFVTGTLNGELIGDTAFVQLRPLTATAGSSTISADSSAIDADGKSSTLVIVHVLDANGNSVGRSAGTVTLTNTLGRLSDVTNHDDGTYSAILTADTVSGTAMITGTLNGEAIGDTVFMQFRPLPPNARTTTITADSAEIDADSMSSTLITVHVRDIHGNLANASTDSVELNTTLGTLSSVTRNQNGTYTATLTAGTRSGVASVTGTLNDEVIGDTAFVQLRPVTPDAGTTTINADSSALNADGKSTTHVTVIVRDASGNPIGQSAGDVELGTNLGGLGMVVDHGDGSYTAVLTAGTVPGIAEITGTLNNTPIGDTAFVTLRRLPGEPTKTTIVADSTAINADGVSRTIITVSVRDTSGNLVGAGGDTVDLRSSLGTPSGVTDHGNGTYTATLTAGTVTGDAIITGTLNRAAISDSAMVTLRPLDPDPTTTTLAADSTSIAANGISSTLVTVRVLDRNLNPVGGSAGEVVLSTTRGILTDRINHPDGRHTAVLRADTTALGTSTDTAVITGTLNGAPIVAVARVELRHETGQPLTTTIDADSTSLEAGSHASTLITVTIRDSSGNRVFTSAGTVILHATDGTLSDVTDHHNGIYTARLKAGVNRLTPAIISGTLNGSAITDTAEVRFR